MGFNIIDCAGIIVGIIRHYEHNFHSKKNTGNIICTFGYFCTQHKIVIYWTWNQMFWPEISVSGKFK